VLHRHAAWMILNTPPLGSEDNRPRLLSGSRGALRYRYTILLQDYLVWSVYDHSLPQTTWFAFIYATFYSGNWCNGYAFPQNFISLQDREAVYESWPGKDRISSCQKWKSNLSYQEFITKECKIECVGSTSAYSYQERNPRLAATLYQRTAANSWLTTEEIFTTEFLWQQHVLELMWFL